MQYQKQTIIKKKSVYDIKMSSQSLEELELKTKNRDIKSYKSMPMNKLLSILDGSEPIK